jgi:hypothetical protein
MWKVVRRKYKVTYRGKLIGLTKDFSTGAVKSWRAWISSPERE